MHRTSTYGTTINIECVGSIDGPAHNKSIDLRGESIYLYPQVGVLNLIDASFLRNANGLVPTA
jgi:hypothetical protein